MIQNFTIKSSLNNNIAVTAYGSENVDSSRIIILIHGFMGFKDWGYSKYFGEYFSKNGFVVITFNFSHNGIGNNKFEFTELEKFSNNTFTLEIAEVLDVINLVVSNKFGNISNPQIALVGHSRGGAIALLAASQTNKVISVVTWGSVSTLDRYSERQKEKFRKNGFFEVLTPNNREKIKIGLPILDDIEKNKETTLNIKTAVEKLEVPLLIIHGEEDLIVKPIEAKEIYNWSDKNISEILIIPNTGHTFGITHPFNGTNKNFEKVLKATKQFLDKNLN